MRLVADNLGREALRRGAAGALGLGFQARAAGGPGVNDPEQFRDRGVASHTGIPVCRAHSRSTSPLGSPAGRMMASHGARSRRAAAASQDAGVRAC